MDDRSRIETGGRRPARDRRATSGSATTLAAITAAVSVPVAVLANVYLVYRTFKVSRHAYVQGCQEHEDTRPEPDRGRPA